MLELSDCVKHSFLYSIFSKEFIFICSSLTYVGDVASSAAAAAAASNNNVAPSACFCERKRSNDSGGIKFNPFYLREMKR